jgi:uncharacterized protein YoxC
MITAMFGPPSQATAPQEVYMPEKPRFRETELAAALKDFDRLATYMPPSDGKDDSYSFRLARNALILHAGRTIREDFEAGLYANVPYSNADELAKEQAPHVLAKQREEIKKLTGELAGMSVRHQKELDETSKLTLRAQKEVEDLEGQMHSLATLLNRRVTDLRDMLSSSEERAKGLEEQLQMKDAELQSMKEQLNAIQKAGQDFKEKMEEFKKELEEEREVS